MALRDIEAYREWIAREVPSAIADRAVRTFLAQLGDIPWRAPSVPIPELSDQPEYEVRTARLDIPGEPAVRVWYRYVYAAEDVDLIAVTGR